MDANTAIIIARKHIGHAIQESSARHCLADALHQYDQGEYDNARIWAAKSLAYSVGIFHADYQRVAGKNTL